MVVHPLYSPEMRPTPTYGPWLTNMGVPREGVMVGFTQFHLSVVVGHPLAMGVLGTVEGPAACVEREFASKRAKICRNVGPIE